VSDYQPRAQRGWPAQPPEDIPGPDGYGQASYGQAGYGQAGYGQAPYGPPRRRRRRRRGWIALLVVVVVILAILGIGDQVARSYAENRIAEQIQSSGLNTKPSVSIAGWPFLTQVAAHDIKTINISANNVTTTGGKLPVNFTATATGVHPDSSFNSATIDHISGQATITYQALDTYLANAIGIQALSSISFSPDPSAGPNVVKADAGIGSVDATVVKTGANQITIKFGSLSGLASLLGSGSIPDQIIDIPQLPAGLVVGQPDVNSQGIVIPASASNTTLTE